jgi:hypothetical protein
MLRSVWCPLLASLECKRDGRNEGAVGRREGTYSTSHGSGYVEYDAHDLV